MNATTAPPLHPRLTAEQVLPRLLELIRTTGRSITDFTPERLQAVLGVPILRDMDGPNSYGFLEQLTPQWGYGFSVAPSTHGSRNVYPKGESDQNPDHKCIQMIVIHDSTPNHGAPHAHP